MADVDIWARSVEELSAVVVSRPSDYEQGAIINAQEFIMALKEAGRAAPRITGGYWPTFCMTWDEGGAENLEVEVFADCFEVYRFFEGRTDIRSEHREPGAPFPPTLLDEVPPLPGAS